MCMLCDDEKAYQAYMDYLDAMERQGKSSARPPIPTRRSAWCSTRCRPPTRPAAEAPENDKTLSPFFCSPVDK